MEVVRYLINTTEETKKALSEIAAKRGQTLTGLIRQILWEWVKENGVDELVREEVET